ncbi:MAG TPA: autotransporter assembly complex family protein [Steroidobacteraceae bacterium]|nr:autotransporter assembly complex family protein [Steroidobacteraceae bacterium]
MTRLRASGRRLPALLFACLACTATVAQAAIRIEIDGVDGDLRRNVLAFLSVERYKDSERIQEDTVVRLYNRIDDEVRSALKPFGYYEPKIQTKFEPNSKDNDWRVEITIDPGMPVMIDTVQVNLEGAGAGDPVLARIKQQTRLRSGERLNHGLYEQVKGDLQRTAAAYGYLDAKMIENELLVDVPQHKADIKLRLDTGQRYSFGAVSIEQSVIRPELMRRFLRFKEGEPYNATELLRTQFALDDSLYFSTVEVLPQDRDRTALTVPISITATKSSRSFSLGAGYGTDTSIRGTFGWTDSRLNDRGHRLRFEIKASSITRLIDARYDIPIGDPALERLSLDVTSSTEQLSDLDTTEFSITPSITQVQGHWQRVLQVSAVNTQTDDGATRRTNNLLVPGISYASVPEGYLGEVLFSRGMYADLIGSHSSLGSDSDFLRLHLQAERVIDLWPRWHLLLRGEFGTSLVKNFDDLPGIYRFFAGGDRSVRGFAYNSLSPVEQVTLRNGTVEMQKIGGRHLVVGSVEIARDLPRNFAVATFFDIGNAFNEFGDPMAYSAGVGLRFRLPVVTIGIDIAQPLSESGSPRLHLNISPKL